MSTPVVNVEQAGYRNGEEAAHWLAYEDRYLVARQCAGLQAGGEGGRT